MRFKIDQNSLREFVREQQNKIEFLFISDLIEEEENNEKDDDNESK